MNEARTLPRQIAFLDRDGTLLWEPPETRQIDSLEKLKILPGVIEGLKQLCKRGFALVMVSNQDGIGTPKFPRKQFELPQKNFLRQLASQGIAFADVFVCPHTPEEQCACRKPKTGLVKDFLRRNGVDLSSSLMIGDRKTDEEFAKNIGVRFVRMETNGRFPRFASLRRKTDETDISIFLNIDGSGRTKIATGIGFFDHMLDLLVKNSLIDLMLRVKGDVNVDEHHTVEDTALALGGALGEALGSKRSIGRYGFLLPMDEALAEIALDLSGRPSLIFKGSFRREYVGDLPTELVAHFFGSFAQALKCNLHMTIRRGSNEHHKIEALFKGLGRCLRQAFRINPFERGIPSAKGSL
ncbi:MAG: bifunctional histidinol-phosphatase/imidazoleglycerol-phosphate dehydratase HisB [Candidatus Peribacteraceae bacterium]|nr:bifunctional histidinol-phosphatase/imidazoleglycerol-phosphate dehydratase HisB [Candidatus Peribacteraceae bacterium]MDD5742081.1 bifunctional histidinol-phosphatase/imidazoleglycerol-phosphate dehydratase HisB [Candidatus Peribacteraceae bacterium]